MCIGELMCGFGKYFLKVLSLLCVDDGYINLLLKVVDFLWLIVEYLLYELCELEFIEVSIF